MPKYTLRVASELTPLPRVGYAFLQYLALQGALRIHRFGPLGPKWPKSAQKGSTPCFPHFSPIFSPFFPHFFLIFPHVSHFSPFFPQNPRRWRAGGPSPYHALLRGGGPRIMSLWPPYGSPNFGGPMWSSPKKKHNTRNHKFSFIKFYQSSVPTSVPGALIMESKGVVFSRAPRGVFTDP